MTDTDELFGEIKDTRHQGYVKHKLSDVLVMIMGAVVCGITELADMMVYFANALPFYKEGYGIERFPSKPTLSRLLSLIDGDAVGKTIIEIMKKNANELGIIAVDGKAIRSTEKKEKVHSYLQILTAYATESGVVLGQDSIEYEEKTNEIPVFQAMLDNMDIKPK